MIMLKDIIVNGVRNMIKNIIFDMGQVLMSFEPKGYVDSVAKSPEAAEAILRELFGGPEWPMLDAGAITDEETVARVQKRIPEYAEDVAAVMENWHVLMKPMPGMENIVKHLKGKEYKLYLLSNASMRFYKYYKNVSIFQYFDGIVISAKEKLVKPDKKIYIRLLNRYNLNAGECLFIDDLQANIEGAESVGINGHQFQGRDELSDFLREKELL